MEFERILWWVCFELFVEYEITYHIVSVYNSTDGFEIDQLTHGTKVLCGQHVGQYVQMFWPVRGFLEREHDGVSFLKRTRFVREDEVLSNYTPSGKRFKYWNWAWLRVKHGARNFSHQVRSWTLSFFRNLCHLWALCDQIWGSCSRDSGNPDFLSFAPNLCRMCVIFVFKSFPRYL